MGSSFLLRRDAWAPASLTTAALLDLSILRPVQTAPRSHRRAGRHLHSDPDVRSHLDLFRPDQSSARRSRVPDGRGHRVGVACYRAARGSGGDPSAPPDPRTQRVDEVAGGSRSLTRAPGRSDRWGSNRVNSAAPAHIRIIAKSHDCGKRRFLGPGPFMYLVLVLPPARLVRCLQGWAG